MTDRVEDRVAEIEARHAEDAKKICAPMTQLSAVELFDETGFLLSTIRALQAEVGELREALKKVRRGPVKPLPDPGAHSWSAFGQAAFQAMRDLQRIASKALADGPSGLAASTIKAQSHDL